jgi:hypothetical protein
MLAALLLWRRLLRQINLRWSGGSSGPKTGEIT